MSSTGVRIDPVGAFNFLITLVDSTSALTATVSAIQSVALGGFSEASGLEMSLEVEEYKEGGRNDMVHKLPTRINWGNIRLKRGVTLSDDLWSWHYAFVEGRGKRRDGIIVLQNDLHLPVKTWHFTKGLPIKWTGPSLNAAQSQVAVEELEIAHEGMRLFSAGTALQTAT